MKQTHPIRTAFCFLLICTMTLILTGCAGKIRNTKILGTNLMEGINAQNVTEKTSDETFVRGQMKLTLDLFKSFLEESKDENVLISPLSIQLALAMTTNGADGKTREEMETLLGENLSIRELNEYLHTYVNNLPSEDKCKLQIANSIWFRDDESLTVKEDFLQTNANYYGAQIYKSAFDNQTVADINNWVKMNTNGMIDTIIDEINPDTVMYLINALAFDAEWQEIYETSDIRNGSFTSISGVNHKVEMMHSAESKYLDDGKATGFIKNYKNGKYSFVALLPNENVDIYEYIDGLTNDTLLQTIENAQSCSVLASIPKFSYEYQLSMNDILKKLGMPTAFDSNIADFSNLGDSSIGNIYISNVLHKTFISVDERGTKAGAVTSVEMTNESAPFYNQYVILDRPFVYMIIDNETNLPFFIGTVMGF